MSRTVRKSSITETRTLTQHLNKHISYLKRRSFYYEYYLTDAGQEAYNKAVEKWVTEYYRCIHYVYIPQPDIWEFKKRRVIFRDIDYNKEIIEASKEYMKFNRDGRFYDGDLNRSFKKHCARDLRRFNRELARKIIKGDDSWEEKPYPDTYLGKKHIWDYF